MMAEIIPLFKRKAWLDLKRLAARGWLIKEPDFTPPRPPPRTDSGIALEYLLRSREEEPSGEQTK